MKLQIEISLLPMHDLKYGKISKCILFINTVMYTCENP